MPAELTEKLIGRRDEAEALGRRLDLVLRGEDPADDAVGATPWRRAFSLLGRWGAFEPPGPKRGACDLVAVFEGLGRGCTDLGFLFAANAHLWGTVLPIHSHGTEAQRGELLPGLLDGSRVGAHAVSEPGAGSDVASMQTTLSPEDGSLRLDGHKTWITGAPVCDLVVVYAREADRPGEPRDDGGLGAVIVPRDAEGLSIRPLRKLGLDGAPMGEVLLDACRLPPDARLGGEGAGMAQFAAALEWERACVFAPVVGAMQRQLDRAVRHARTRRQFGRPIGSFQATADRVVAMRNRLDIGRLLLYRAARHKEAGRAPVEAAQAKLYLSEAFLQSSLDAVQVRGAAGYLDEAEEARDLRDAAAGPIFSGTSEIQRRIIARFLGLP